MNLSAPEKKLAEVVEMDKPKPQLLLPFAEKEWVDTNRARRILGVSWGAIDRMAASGFIHRIQVRSGAWNRIRYQSIIDHCDRLRQEYGIPDMRPTLSAPGLRHRDEDLLPFRLRDTIGVREATAALGYTWYGSVFKMCQEGRFWCYRVHPTGPWRIYSVSFQAYLSRVMDGTSRGTAYKIPE